jgi:16S rRNA (guanine(966)-N(2))-methyltransferase RsmD
MRITGGKYAGRQILFPKGETRPAMDRMRESFFSILEDIEGKSFLDLFSGSGVVGIEAASRGAEPVFLVERDRKKRSYIEQNCRFVEEEIKIISMPAERFILRARRKFDIIFCDPPFAYAYKTDLLKKISQADLISRGGIVLIHLPKRESLPLRVANLSFSEERLYGTSSLRFFRGTNRESAE